MTVAIWVVEGTWASCVAAAMARTGAEEAVVLIHVTPEEIEDSAHAAYAGLLGRGRPDRDPGATLHRLAADAEEQLLHSAQAQVGRSAAWVRRTGKVEREVVAAAEEAGADLLVAARDGDRSRLGPRSLGPATRFVVDHAPCPVLLIWPGDTPDVGSIPPPPQHGPGHPPPPHPAGHPPPPPHPEH